MADEITIDMRFEIANGNYQFKRNVKGFTADQVTAGGGGPGTVSVTTSEGSEDMTGYGFVWLQNLDATNFVQIGFATTDYGIRLRAGGPPLLIELEPGTTVFYKADTATCLVDIIGFNL